MKMIISVSKCLKRNFKLTKVSITCKNYILLSKKTPKFKYWLLKFLCLETQMVWFGWLRNWLTLFVFVALTKMLCCWLMQWTGTSDTKTWSRRSFTTLAATNASCIGMNLVLALQLWKNFLIKKSKNMYMMRNLITVNGTLQIPQYWQTLQLRTKNTKRLWYILLTISSIVKLKNYQFLIQYKI